MFHLALCPDVVFPLFPSKLGQCTEVLGTLCSFGLEVSEGMIGKGGGGGDGGFKLEWVAVAITISNKNTPWVCTLVTGVQYTTRVLHPHGQSITDTLSELRA